MQTPPGQGKRLTATENDRAARAFARRLHDDFGVEHVYLFGSQATGRATPDSDYDLIIVSSSFEAVPRIRRGMGIRGIFYEVGGFARWT